MSNTTSAAQVFAQRYQNGFAHPWVYIMFVVSTGLAFFLNAAFLLVACLPSSVHDKTVQQLMLCGQSSMDGALGLFLWVWNIKQAQLGHYISTNRAVCTAEGALVFLMCGGAVLHLMLIAEVRRRAITYNFYPSRKLYYLGYILCWFLAAIITSIPLGFGAYQIQVCLFPSVCLLPCRVALFVALFVCRMIELCVVAKRHILQW